MCLAQGHNAVKSLRLKPVTTQSRGKHSTTEPLRSPLKYNPLLIILRVLLNLVSILWEISKHHRTICTKLFSNQASTFQAKHFCKRSGNPFFSSSSGQHVHQNSCFRPILKCNRPFIILRVLMKNLNTHKPCVHFMGPQLSSQNQMHCFCLKNLLLKFE